MKSGSFRCPVGRARSIWIVESFVDCLYRVDAFIEGSVGTFCGYFVAVLVLQHVVDAVAVRIV